MFGHQDVILRKFRRFISITAVQEYASEFIDHLNKNDATAANEFSKALNKFMEETSYAEYSTFLANHPRFKEFIQRKIVNRYNKGMIAFFRAKKIPDNNLSEIEQEFKKFFESPHEDLSGDYKQFIKAQCLRLNQQRDGAYLSDQFDIEFNQLENMLINLHEGYCFGLSLTDALHKDWEGWEKQIKAWDGRNGSLDHEVKMQESKKNPAQPKNLRALISLGIQYAVPLQVDHPGSSYQRIYSNYLTPGVDQNTKLKPAAHQITRPKTKKDPEETVSRSHLEISVFKEKKDDKDIYEIKSVQKHIKISGDFETTLSSVLDEKTIEGNICLVHAKNHTGHLKYDEGEWEFYDPNMGERFRGDKKKIATDIMRQLGTSISIEVASFNPEQELKFPAYDTILENSPESLLAHRGLHFLRVVSPELLENLFQKAQDSPPLRKAIAEALVRVDKDNVSGLASILKNRKLALALFNLAEKDEQIRSRIASAIHLRDNKSINAFQLLVSDHPDLFLRFLELAKSHIIFFRVLNNSSFEQFLEKLQKPDIFVIFLELANKQNQSTFAYELTKSIINYTKYILDNFSHDPKHMLELFKLAEQNDELKKCLINYIIEINQNPRINSPFAIVKMLKSPEVCELFFELIRSSDEGGNLKKRFAQIIQSENILSDLPVFNLRNPQFIQQLFRFAEEKEGTDVRLLIQEEMRAEFQKMSKGLLTFSRAGALHHLFHLAKKDQEFKEILVLALLKGGIHAKGVDLIFSYNNLGINALFQFALNENNKDLNAAIVGALLSPTGQTGQTVMDCLVSYSSQPSPEFLRFVGSQNQPALDQALISSLAIVKDENVKVAQQYLQTPSTTESEKKNTANRAKKIFEKGESYFNAQQNFSAFKCYTEALELALNDKKTKQSDLNTYQNKLLSQVYFLRQAAYGQVHQCNMALHVHRRALDLLLKIPPGKCTKEVNDFLGNDPPRLVTVAEEYCKYGHYNQAIACFSEALYQLDSVKFHTDMSQYKTFLKSRVDYIKSIESTKTPPLVQHGSFSPSDSKETSADSKTQETSVLNKDKKL